MGPRVTWAKLTLADVEASSLVVGIEARAIQLSSILRRSKTAVISPARTEAEIRLTRGQVTGCFVPHTMHGGLTSCGIDYGLRRHHVVEIAPWDRTWSVLRCLAIDATENAEADASDIRSLISQMGPSIVVGDGTGIGRKLHKLLAKSEVNQISQIVPGYFDSSDQNRRESRFLANPIVEEYDGIVISKPALAQEILGNIDMGLLEIATPGNEPFLTEFAKHHAAVSVRQDKRTGRLRYMQSKSNDHFFDAHVLALAGLHYLRKLDTKTQNNSDLSGDKAP